MEEGEARVGVAIWIPDLNYASKFKLNTLSSSFTAEAIAIVKALDYILENRIKFANICSDSLSVLQALLSIGKSNHKLCPLINDIKNRMQNLMGEIAHQQVRFTWCPAHVGIRGNEKADSEAKSAATSGQVINNLVDYLQITSHLRNEYKELDIKFVNTLNSEAGSWFTKDLSHFNISMLRGADLGRSEACKLIRMIADCAYTGYYLFRINARDSPNCECGARIQDLNHLFFECVLLSEPRKKLYTELLKMELPTPFSIKYVLFRLNIKICKLVSKFIDDAKLRI